MPKPSATCKHEGCGVPASGGKGYCRRHYTAWKRGKLAKPRYKTCRAEGCRKPMVARGRCQDHVARKPGAPAPEAGA